MSTRRVAAVRISDGALAAFTRHVEDESPNTPRDRGVPGEPGESHTALRVDAADALLRLARREIAATGEVSAATAAALRGAVRSLSYAELHGLIADQSGPGASGVSGDPGYPGT